MLRIWRNREFILVLSLILGVAIGGGAVYTEALVLPGLAAVMTLALLEVPGTVFKSWRNFLGPTAVCLLLNHLLLAALLIGLGQLLVSEPGFRQGLTILAAVPPAVAVIPFTVLLGGDRVFSLLGTVGAYVTALIITPLVTLLFLDGGLLVYPDRIALIVAELILGPLLLSRLLLFFNLTPWILPWRGPLTNWLFFLITYTIVGLNRELFLHQPWSLWPLFVIAGSSTFIWGEIIDLVGRWAGVAAPRRLSLVLLGTLKNYGLAGGLALTLFDRTRAVPATVATVFMIIYVVWLNLKLRSRLRVRKSKDNG